MYYNIGMDRIFLRKKLEEFYLEDIGYSDITTDNLETDKEVEATIVSKEDAILAGLNFVKEVFLLVDNSLKITVLKTDGEEVKKGEEVLKINGSGKSILKAERLALNILQRLSGIATKTRKFAKILEDSKVKLLDTRKTTPGFRAFEKYAVKVGGGYNHRFALYDMVMIKDNHIALAGSVKEAIRQIRKKVSPMVKIEVEVSNFSQLNEAIEENVDIIMLDNMSLDEIKESIKLIRSKNKHIKIEVSGNITEEKLQKLKDLDIDFVSSGALIHSSRWIDFSLRFL